MGTSNTNSTLQFNLLRYFSIASLVVVVFTTVVVGVLSYTRARDALLQSSEEYAASIAENISYQLANDPELSVATAEGNVSLESPEAMTKMAVALPIHLYGFRIDKFKVFDAAARIVYSTEAGDTGKIESANEGIETARTGKTFSEYGSIPQDQSPQNLPGTFIESYAPLYAQGTRGGAQNIIGFVEIYRDVTALNAELTNSAITAAVTVGIAMLLLYVALLLIVRRADSILTQQRRALQEKNQELEQLQQYRDDLTNMFVHDLRNPMTSIIGNLSLLEEESDAFDADQKIMLSASIQSSQDVMKLLNDLLAINSIEQGTLNLKRENFDAAQWLGERATRLEGVSQKQGVQLRLQVEPQGLSVYGDRALLTRVVDNLVTNALHYTDAGGIIRLRAQTDGDKQIKIAIQDTGKGIAPEDAARIFEKFYRASDTGTHASGLGLGLSLCQLAVQAHGGKIWVESQKGIGSTFAFTLPVN